VEETFYEDDMVPFPSKNILICLVATQNNAEIHDLLVRVSELRGTAHYGQAEDMSEVTSENQTQTSCQTLTNVVKNVGTKIILN
jgi:hypothetical protein